MPVAVDQHIHRRLKDEEGKLFASVLKQAGRGLGGRSQGVYIFAPSGTLLAFANTADAAHVKRLMKKALDSSEPAPPAIDYPDAPKASPVGDRPKGTLIALVTTKVLGGYEKVEGRRTPIHAASLGEDHLWIRPDEADALARGSFPDSLLQRMVRYHFVDNTRGEPPFWRTDEVRRADVRLNDEGVLDGKVELQTQDEQRGFEAEVFGHLETKDGKLSRFDLVARGWFHGEGRFTRGAPPMLPFKTASSFSTALTR